MEELKTIFVVLTIVSAFIFMTDVSMSDLNMRRYNSAIRAFLPSIIFMVLITVTGAVLLVGHLV